MNFINLDTKTPYTKDFDSLIRIDDLIKKIKSEGGEYLSVADQDMMYSYVEVVKKARKNNLKPVIGLTVDTNYEGKKFKIVIYPKTLKGFKKEIKVSSLVNRKKEVSIQEILGILEEVIVVFEFQNKYERKQMIENVMNLVNRRKVTPYIGVMITNENQIQRAKVLSQTAKDVRVPIVALQNIKFWKGQEKLMEMMLGIKGLKKPQRYTNYWKNKEEVKELYSDFEYAIRNTEQIAKDAYKDYPLRGDKNYQDTNAKFKVPSDYKISDFSDKVQFLEGYEIPKNEESLKEISYLVDAVYSNPKLEEYKKQYGTEIVEKRIKYELGVIIGKNYQNYVLIVKDFIDYAKNFRKDKVSIEFKMRVGPGRGSSAASFVAYLLGIVKVNAVEKEYLFERFLNPAVETHDPDIDIDISREFRKQMFRYAKEKYGENKVAKVATFGRYAGASNIIDLGKEMKIDKKIIESITKKITKGNGKGLKKLEKYKGEITRLIEEEPKVKILLALANQIDGLPRNQSIHAAGIVMLEENIEDLYPTYVSYDEDLEEDILVIQVDKDFLSDVGVIKIDFLGLKTLDVIQETIMKIKKDLNIEIDIDNLPLDDEKTYKLFEKGELVGVFQMDSKGMRETSKKVKPKNINDIAHLIAIYRPGAIKMIDKYAENLEKGENKIWTMNERKNEFGEDEIIYQEIKEGEEILKPILAKTSGIILYQEQIMRILGVWAGFTPTEADVYRRNISKKKDVNVLEMKKEFIQKSTQMGRDAEASEAIFDLIEKFMEYGFNEPHSGVYALIAYITAYLKANYPVYYMSALLNSLMDEAAKKMPIYMEEIFNMGLILEQPNILNPTPKFEVMNEKTMSYGLEAIRTMGEEKAKHILEIHNKKQFVSFQDFMRRIDKRIITKEVVDALIYTGLFDKFQNRKTMQEEYKRIQDKYKNYSGLVLLEEIDGIDTDYKEVDKTKEFEEYEKEYRDKKEKFFTHTNFVTEEEQSERRKIRDVNREVMRTTTDAIFGKLVEVKVINDKNNNEMAFIGVDVGTKIVNITIFQKEWKTIKEGNEMKMGDLLYVFYKENKGKKSLTKFEVKKEKFIVQITLNSQDEYLEKLHKIKQWKNRNGFDQITFIYGKEKINYEIVISRDVMNEIKNEFNGGQELNVRKAQL